jgi:hypothetical protein
MKNKRIKIYFTGKTIPIHLEKVAQAFENNADLYDSEIFTEKIESNFVYNI